MLKAPSKIATPSLKTFDFNIKNAPTLENADPQASPFTVHTLKRKLEEPSKKVVKKPLVPQRRLSNRLAKPLIKLASKPTGLAPKAKDKAKPTGADKKVDEEPPRKKRAAWDVKGRLQDLEEKYTDNQVQLTESTDLITNMKTRLKDSESTISELLTFKQSLESTVQTKEREKSDVEHELELVKTKERTIALEHANALSTLEANHLKTLKKLEDDLRDMSNKFEITNTSLVCSQQECIQLRSTITTQTAASFSMETENKLLKKRIDDLDSVLHQKTLSIDSLEKQVAGLTLDNQNFEVKLRQEESMRRRLHNEIQELKGNIRVFCRVRPMLDSESNQDEIAKLSFEGAEEGTIELTQFAENATGSKTVSKSFPFSFDRVFPPQTLQNEVFDEISQLVQSALDGYNVCIFAYGQTGSGKTFTMQGPEHLQGPDDVNMGMIPRAVQQIFKAISVLSEKGWTYKMECRYIEIYNETVRDLLDSGSLSKKYDIKHDAKTGKTTVTDAKIVEVTDPSHVFEALQKASENRAVAATNCNERSSRSHSVFTLVLSGKNALTEETSEGLLNLIDLAGSERLSQSGSTGDRLKETQAINKSLSSLGDVIYALANKESHIPYRNSKLTYLLQNSLGGNSKTLMFVNVSPLSMHFQETLCSLRFATKVNSCQIGTAKRLVK